MNLFTLDGNSTDFNFKSDDKAWNLDGKIKEIQVDNFCHTIHLSLFNFQDWKFRPKKSAKLTYTINGTTETLTVFPKVLLKRETIPPPDRPEEPAFTTFTLYAREKKGKTHD